MSLANKTGMDLLFSTFGKSLTYIRKSKGPRMEPCIIPCLTLAQLESEELFILLLQIDTL